jgi:hypothetical protein
MLETWFCRNGDCYLSTAAAKSRAFHAPRPFITRALYSWSTQSHTMMINSRWKILLLFSAAFILLVLLKSPYSRYSSQYSNLGSRPGSYGVFQRPHCSSTAHHDNTKFQWACVPTRYPVSRMRSLPVAGSNKIPRIQATFPKESSSERTTRLARLDAVKGNFSHAWEGYKSHAWLRDEVMPLSGRPHDPFGGWAASLVDSLGWSPLSLLGCSSTLSNITQILCG